jgi:hypothetical protein
LFSQLSSFSHDADEVDTPSFSRSIFAIEITHQLLQVRFFVIFLAYFLDFISRPRCLSFFKYRITIRIATVTRRILTRINGRARLRIISCPYTSHSGARFSAMPADILHHAFDSCRSITSHFLPSRTTLKFPASGSGFAASFYSSSTMSAFYTASHRYVSIGFHSSMRFISSASLQPIFYSISLVNINAYFLSSLNSLIWYCIIALHRCFICTIVSHHKTPKPHMHRASLRARMSLSSDALLLGLIFDVDCTTRNCPCATMF